MAITISGTTGIDAGSLPVANTGKISAGSGLPAILNTAGVDRVTVDTAGNVGIGTSSPTKAKVQVSGTTSIPTNDSNTQIHTILLQDTADKPSLSLFANSGNSIIYATSAEQYRSSLIHRYNADSGNDCFKVEQLRPISGDTLERLKIDSGGRVTMPYQPAFIAVGISADVATNAPLVFVTNNPSVPSQRSSGYSTSTGAFTAPVSGFYQFNFTAYDFNTGDKSIYEVRKNGAAYYNVAGDHFQMQEATDAAMTTWSFNIYLQVNDYIQMGKRVGTLNLYSGHTMWSGYLIG